MIYMNIVAFYDIWIQIYSFVRWSAVKKKHVYLLTKTPSALIERPSYKKLVSEWDLTDVNILLIILLFKYHEKYSQILMSMPSHYIPFQNICLVCEDPSPHIFYCYLIFRRSHYLSNQHFRTRTHQISIKNLF